MSDETFINKLLRKQCEHQEVFYHKMTSTSGGYTINPSSHSYNPFGMAPTSSSVMPSEQRIQRWNPYINGQNAYINQPISQYVPNQQQVIKMPWGVIIIIEIYKVF